MKFSHKKIPSFTLTEMLVVLAISAIVAGLSFSIITLFTKNLQLIQNNYYHSTELQLLEQQFIVDFNRFHTINYNSKTSILKLKSPIDSLFYSFDEGYILRDQDTIFSKAYTKEFYYLGETKQNGDMDALKLSFKDKSSERFLYFFKLNAANQFIRNGN